MFRALAYDCFTIHRIRLFLKFFITRYFRNFRLLFPRNRCATYYFWWLKMVTFVMVSQYEQLPFTNEWFSIILICCTPILKKEKKRRKMYLKLWFNEWPSTWSSKTWKNHFSLLCPSQNKLTDHSCVSYLLYLLLMLTQRSSGVLSRKHEIRWWNLRSGCTDRFMYGSITYILFNARCQRRRCRRSC